MSMEMRADSPIPYPARLPGRTVSFVLAVALAALILVYPGVIADSVSDVRHGLLSLLMWGIAAGFVHGIGFVPRTTIWRLLFNPALGWPLMLGGLALFVFGR
jgi:cyd operon protein YbgE